MFRVGFAIDWFPERLGWQKALCGAHGLLRLPRLYSCAWREPSFVVP